MYRSGIPAGKGFETLFDTQAPSQVSGPPLDPAQRRVVEHPGGPLLVLAGPGTGKTHTLVEAVICQELIPDRRGRCVRTRC